MANSATIDKSEVERELGLTPGRLHLGIVGQARSSKDVHLVVDALIASGRDDLDLLVLSLAPDDPIPAHPQVSAYRYEKVPRPVYNRRLAVIDVFVLPVAVDSDMLTTGVVGDVVGLGRPALVSEWPYLTEILGDAGIRFGCTVDDLAACLRGLNADRLLRASAASRALQRHYAWDVVAAHTLSLIEAVGTCKL